MLFTFSLHAFEYSHEWVFTEIFSLFQNRKCQRKLSKTQMFPRNEPESTIPIVNRLGLLEQSLPVSFQSLLSQVYMQWFKTWICKKKSYIDLSILLDKIHIFTVYILLYQSLVPVGIHVLKHSVILIFFLKKAKEQIGHE